MLSVTAIVPTCRRPGLLQRALRSIAVQTRPPQEVVVIDDAADGSGACDRAAGASGLVGVRVVANARTSGASGARNTGADHGRGEVLAFLDDDDEWLPTYLAEAMARFEAEALDVMCTDLVYRFDDGSPSRRKQVMDRLAPDLFLTRNPGLIGSNLIVRRSLYGEIGGFDESLPAANDIDFGVRVSLRPGVRYAPLHAALVCHHRHSGARLSIPRSPAVCVGLAQFYRLHAHRMTPAQQDEFRRMVRTVWGIDELGNVVA